MGGSVFHCPFRDGREVDDRPLGALASGAAVVQRDLNFPAFSDRITPLPNGGDLTDQQQERLADGGVDLAKRLIGGPA